MKLIEWIFTISVVIGLFLFAGSYADQFGRAIYWPVTLVKKEADNVDITYTQVEKCPRSGCYYENRPSIFVNDRIMKSACIGIKSICNTGNANPPTFAKHIVYYQIDKQRILIDSMTYQEGEDVITLNNTFNSKNVNGLKVEFAKRASTIRWFLVLTVLLIIFGPFLYKQLRKME